MLSELLRLPPVALLIAASEQDHNSVAVFSKIDAITWPEVDLVLMNTFPNPFTFEKFPCARRYKATVTFAAAEEFNPLNHRPNGDSPEASVYSRT